MNSWMNDDFDVYEVWWYNYENEDMMKMKYDDG